MNEWTTPPVVQWPKWLKKWEREGHLPEDLKRLTKLVSAGEIKEAEGREVVEQGKTDTVEYLADRGVISDAEFKVIQRAFQRIAVDEPLGEPEVIPTISPNSKLPRREYVLAQEFRGVAYPDTDRELVLSDPHTKRKLGTLTFQFEGYRHLVIGDIFVVKNEWTERYPELLFAEMLRRYPSVTTVTFDLPGYDLQLLRRNVGTRAPPDELIRGSRAYQIATYFGFRDFKFIWQRGVEEEFGARILATRSTPLVR